MEEIAYSYWALDDFVRLSAIDAAWDAAVDVVGEDFQYAACGAAVNVTSREVLVL